jgi:hypothetical protein
MPGVFAGLKRFARIQTNGLVLKVARIPECFQREVEFRSIKVPRKKFRETAAAIFVKKQGSKNLCNVRVCRDFKIPLVVLTRRFG